MFKFVESPNLPDSKVKVAAVGEDYVDVLKKALEQYGIKLLSSPKNPFVDKRLRSHIDLSVFHIVENHFLLAKHLGESNFAEELKRQGAELTVSNVEMHPTYPNDARLCALNIGGSVFHNLKTSDPYIKSLFSGEILHVNQGYSKCIVCPVTKGAAISSDSGITRAMRELGFDVLEITPGYIELEGFSEGFIGGSAFKLSQDMLAFTGTLDEHPDKFKINDFLKKHGVIPVYLTERPIFDVGSIVPIIEE